MDNHAMTLYRELRSKVSVAPLSELLQSTVLLAADVKNQEAEKWAKLELGGYFKANPEMNKDVVVPEYRTIVGIWHDRFGSPLIIDNPKLHFLNSTRLRNGVAELEDLSQSEITHTMIDPGMAEIFRKEMNVEVDRIVFGSREVVGVLSNIRTRLVEVLGKLRDTFGAREFNPIFPEDIKTQLETEGFYSPVY